jgi:hypothetical protein
LLVSHPFAKDANGWGTGYRGTGSRGTGFRGEARCFRDAWHLKPDT